MFLLTLINTLFGENRYLSESELIGLMEKV